MTATLDATERRPAGVCTIPEEDYFAATYALSASGAKAILDCPARFRWMQDHPAVKKEFDFGSAAHLIVLGAGPEIQVIDAACLRQLADTEPDPKTAKLYADTAAKGDPAGWTTNAAKAARDQARAAGKIPLLAGDYRHVKAMAAAIQRHPIAGRLFDPDAGLPEQSLFWHDDEHGIERRARLDWLPDPRGGPLDIPDYKTTTDCSPDGCRKAIGSFGYHIPRTWYCDAARACGLSEDPAFMFVFQEKTAPYFVNVVQLDDAAIASGRIACDAAMERYRDCLAAGSWPEYPLDIPELSVSPWNTRIPEDYYR